jgi:Tfp pilus assembly pilus retraction ATPase PilT
VSLGQQTETAANALFHFKGGHLVVSFLSKNSTAQSPHRVSASLVISDRENVAGEQPA